MGWLTRWREERRLRNRATSFVRALKQDPSEEDVAWPAQHEPAGDMDHARWELRYVRRALGLIAARSEALDDRIPAAVAHGLAAAIRVDPDVDPAKQEVAERQFNARLRAYSEAMEERAGDASQATLVAWTLLGFVGVAGMPPETVTARAAQLVENYLREMEALLEKEFGRAVLPPDIAPSQVKR